jgi:hypothetical protein
MVIRVTDDGIYIFIILPQLCLAEIDESDNETMFVTISMCYMNILLTVVMTSLRDFRPYGLHYWP